MREILYRPLIKCASDVNKSETSEGRRYRYAHITSQIVNFYLTAKLDTVGLLPKVYVNDQCTNTTRRASSRNLRQYKTEAVLLRSQRCPARSCVDLYGSTCRILLLT